jgi:hypothetical protein
MRRSKRLACSASARACLLDGSRQSPGQFWVFSPGSQTPLPHFGPQSAELLAYVSPRLTSQTPAPLKGWGKGGECGQSVRIGQPPARVKIGGMCGAQAFRQHTGLRVRLQGFCTGERGGQSQVPGVQIG